MRKGMLILVMAVSFLFAGQGVSSAADKGGMKKVKAVISNQKKEAVADKIKEKITGKSDTKDKKGDAKKMIKKIIKKAKKAAVKK